MTERRIAIVTGAANGIGLETARRFLNDSKYNPVFAVDIDPKVHTAFQSPNLIPLVLDLGDKDQITKLFKIVKDCGEVDVVVNAAGVINAGKPSTYYDKMGNAKNELKDMDAINMWAPILITAHAPMVMKKNGNGGGTIINITSSKHFFPDIYRFNYMDGKKRVSKVTKKLHGYYKEKYGIRLVDVQPGNTKTEIDKGIWTDGNGKREVEAVQALNDWWRKTFGNDPKKVADVIYKVAEGKVTKNTVYVGWDAKLGRVLSFIPFSGDIFFAGSHLVYKAVEVGRALKKK